MIKETGCQRGPRTAILLSAIEDSVSLCEVIKHVGDAHPVVGVEQLRELTLQVLCDLLRDGLLVPGEVGARFEPWSLGVEEAVAVVSQEWSVPILEIDPLHGWWFDLTPAGEIAAGVLDERERRRAIREGRRS